MRTNLNHQVNAQVGQRSDAACERHGLSGVPPPVVAVERGAGVHRPAGQVAYEGHGGRLKCHSAKGGFQRDEGWFDKGAMKCTGCVQPSYPDAL